jgi:hypothetical protein
MNNCIVNDIHHESKVSLVCSICQARGYERLAENGLNGKDINLLAWVFI